MVTITLPKFWSPPLKRTSAIAILPFLIFGSDYMQYLLVTTAAIFVAPWPLLAQNNASYFTKTSYVLTPNGPESIQSKENTSAVMSYFHIFPPSIFSRKNLQNPKWVLFLPPPKKNPHGNRPWHGGQPPHGSVMESWRVASGEADCWVFKSVGFLKIFLAKIRWFKNISREIILRLIDFF